MRDWIEDWRRWSAAERVLAVVLGLLLISLPFAVWLWADEKVHAAAEPSHQVSGLHYQEAHRPRAHLQGGAGSGPRVLPARCPGAGEAVFIAGSRPIRVRYVRAGAPGARGWTAAPRRHGWAFGFADSYRSSLA
jgi:hypothetical protein